ncbi:nucleotidyl transferase AbiEii/AbiGii toxin family protein [Methylobacterium haplocladii]|uniref:Uncharacterized protein n=1 Tax=Methylobacterium haplocladii TaxID=1176176 RepID=A0A512IMP5_9HYPH|nr:nucleotidyl transferase AbiEii/AbiGii toxin family protein [Methylobacterium haplocladii]GEO98980.1 hypothetical protein MHA02_13680 [Methylobacterium haplocladii]GJD84173.1 hypothetical protein HPGCJGGD_2048 [Methylobacterium haplocladii]GLS60321.1 hypothetical protein GCM10007887_30000 [Methylobacterium haplocladii]
MSAPETRWRELLDLALPALDHVFGAEADETKPAPWTLGGGTAIALSIDHRVSYDVDLFVPTVPLKLFTPARNPAAARISPNFQWPGHSLKFERAEGEIDFLSPVLQTEPGYGWRDYGARRIPVETPEEVVVKKIRFRAARFTARDVFDLAAVANVRPGLAKLLAQEVSDALQRTCEALELQAARGTEALAQSIVPTPSSAGLVAEAFTIGRRVLAEAILLAASRRA